MSKWRDAGKCKPRLTRTHKEFGIGVPVLIWPHYEEPGTSPTPFAYFGTRYGNGKDPVFYIYGREVWPTHWQPLPDGPSPRARELLYQQTTRGRNERS